MQDHDQSKSIAPAEASGSQTASLTPKVGDVRRIPDGGPVYEVMAIVDECTVCIQMIESSNPKPLSGHVPENPDSQPR